MLAEILNVGAIASCGGDWAQSLCAKFAIYEIHERFVGSESTRERCSRVERTTRLLVEPLYQHESQTVLLCVSKCLLDGRIRYLSVVEELLCWLSLVRESDRERGG